MKNHRIGLIVVAVLPVALITGCAANAADRRQDVNREVREDRR